MEYMKYKKELENLMWSTNQAEWIAFCQKLIAKIQSMDEDVSRAELQKLREKRGRQEDELVRLRESTKAAGDRAIILGKENENLKEALLKLGSNGVGTWWGYDGEES